jgi:cell division protein ZapD
MKPQEQQDLFQSMLSTSPDGWISYEQPLSERVRTLLRLEYLFKRVYWAQNGSLVWDSRTTIETLIDIIAVLSRADIKKELIKELGRHALTLDSLAQNPKVDPSRLIRVADSVNDVLLRLKELNTSFGQILKHHELFNAVRQRSSIPAGSCDFDLPAYHYWLQKPAEQRIEDLQLWVGSFSLLSESVDLCLALVRDSGVSSNETAAGGFFQRNLESTSPCQMIRVFLASNSPFFPEISAGRHRFSVRFMEQLQSNQRASQSQEDISFKLVSCII